MSNGCGSVPSRSSVGGGGNPPSTPALAGSIFPVESTSSFEIEELHSSYGGFTQERELDTWVRALGRGKIHKDTLLELYPEITKGEVSGSVKRLHSRGYLTNMETQDVMKLFGGW